MGHSFKKQLAVKLTMVLGVILALALIGAEAIAARGSGHLLPDGTFCENMYAPAWYCEHDRYHTGELAYTHEYKVFSETYVCNVEKLACLHYHKCAVGHRFDYVTAYGCCVSHDSCGRTEEIYLCTAGWQP